MHDILGFLFMLSSLTRTKLSKLFFVEKLPPVFGYFCNWGVIFDIDRAIFLNSGDVGFDLWLFFLSLAYSLRFPIVQFRYRVLW